MEDRLKNIMAAVFDIPAKEINQESSPDTIASWDSLKHMNLVLALEDEFGVHFEDEEIVEMLNFQLIKSVLSKKMAVAVY